MQTYFAVIDSVSRHKFHIALGKGCGCMQAELSVSEKNRSDRSCFPAGTISFSMEKVRQLIFLDN